jgi:hypothetical protein
VTNDTSGNDSSTTGGPARSEGRTGRDRYSPRSLDAQRNLAERLFPGPTRRMSNNVAENIGELLKPLDGDGTGVPAWRNGRPRPSSTAPAPAVSPEDLAKVRESLEQQNELLRALLASSVDTQEDARSTAQNSRTFAWAGTAIALLTLIATIISIVAALRA